MQSERDWRDVIIDYSDCLELLTPDQFEDLLVILYADGTPRPANLRAVSLSREIIKNAALQQSLTSIAKRRYKELAKCLERTENGKKINDTPAPEDFAGHWAENSDDYVTITKTRPAKEADERLHSVQIVIVIDNENKPIGLITSTDILNLVSLDDKICEDFMVKKMTCVNNNTEMKDVLEIFKSNPFDAVPVIDEDKVLIGVVTRREIVDWKNQQN